jgi:hypothetical protein
MMISSQQVLEPSCCCVLHASCCLFLLCRALFARWLAMRPSSLPMHARSPKHSPRPPPLAPAQVWNSGADTVYHYDGTSQNAGGHAIICFGAPLVVKALCG